MALASLSHNGRTLWLRTNPNSITWDYNLNTRVDETYGGRVVQILSVNIDNLVVKADSGNGGWPYFQQVGLFFRDLLVAQRDGGQPAVFEYPNRGWKFSVYALSFPFKDSVEDIAKEFTLNFKVQEDVSGVASQATIAAELTRLREGIGYTRNQYNDPDMAGGKPADQAAPPGTPDAPANTGPTSPFLPNVNDLIPGR